MAQLSVIIPFLNAEPHIRCCITSVLRQTLSDLEIICIDNGSTDRSRAVVEELAASDGRIQLLNCATTGAGVARNTGIAAARGDYLAFVDADDYLPTPSAFERLYVHAIASNAEMSRGNLAILHQGCSNSVPLTTLGVTLWWQNNVVTTFDDDARLWLPVQHQAYIMCRRFVEANDLLYPSQLRGQDALFILRAMFRAKRVHCSNDTSYMYRKGHKDHAVLKTPHALLAFVESMRDVRALLLRAGRTRQWHLVLARTCAYLRGVCPMSYLFSDPRLLSPLSTLLEDNAAVGQLDYSPYRVQYELDCVRALANEVRSRTNAAGAMPEILSQ